MATLPPNEDRTCPTCGAQFDKPPQRTRKCKKCGNPAVAKGDPKTMRRRLMTVEEAAIVEAQWGVYHDEKYPKTSPEQVAGWTREYIRTVSQHRDCVGIRVHRGPGCDVDGCPTQEYVVPIMEAVQKAPIPCGVGPQCYGWVTSVFNDERPDLVRTDPPPPPMEVTEEAIWNGVRTFGLSQEVGEQAIKNLKARRVWWRRLKRWIVGR